jgi:hypothetical protein
VTIRLFAIGACCASVAFTAGMAAQGGDAYLSWSAAQAESVGRQAYKQGRVGGIFDMRMLKTERSYNYKLAATWMTPEVIRAAARLAQLRSRLSEEGTRELVAEAEASGGTVVMVEIDPREGSGVIPNEWEAFVQPKGRSSEAVAGVNTPRLRDVKALAGVLRRNYDYDRFWLVFPAGDAPYLHSDVLEVELVVRIYDKEGRVSWPVPPLMRKSVPDGDMSAGEVLRPLLLQERHRSRELVEAGHPVLH